MNFAKAEFVTELYWIALDCTSGHSVVADQFAYYFTVLLKLMYNLLMAFFLGLTVITCAGTSGQLFSVVTYLAQNLIKYVFAFLFVLFVVESLLLLYQSTIA